MSVRNGQYQKTTILHLFGTAQAQKVIGQLNALGQIGTLYNNFYQLKSLQPEYATGTHLTLAIERLRQNH